MSEFQVSQAVGLLNPSILGTVPLPERHVPMSVRSSGLTDSGRVRTSNEDQFLIAVLFKALQVQQTSLPQANVQHCTDRSYLFVVADGMSGHAGGKQARALTIDSVETYILETFKWFARFKGQEQDPVLADFQRAMSQANARVMAEAVGRPELHGLGTTLTLAYSLNDVLFVVHVGDSRCYLYRDGTLHRLTQDPTLVEDLVRRGVRPAEDAASYCWRHVITNVVGGDSAAVKIEIHKVSLEGGDRILLCSDGLTKMLAEEEINQILEAEDQPEQACRRLVTRANEAGGRDNITAVVAHFHYAMQPDVSGKRCPPSGTDQLDQSGRY